MVQTSTHPTRTKVKLPRMMTDYGDITDRIRPHISNPLSSSYQITIARANYGTHVKSNRTVNRTAQHAH